MNEMLYDDYEAGLDAALAYRGAPGQQARAAALRRQQRPISTPSSGVETPAPQPGANPRAAPDYRSMALDALKQAGDLGEPSEEERGKLAEFARSRAEGSDRDLMLGLALQAKGGESLAPVGGMFLKRALAAQEPMKLGGGLVMGSGEFIVDPEQAQSRRAQRLETRARIYESMAQHADSVEQRREAANAAAELRRTIAEAKKDNLHLQRAGTTPSGELVTFNPATGVQMVNGQPYTGPVMSQAALDKQAQTVQEALSAGNRLRNLDQMVAQNPNAFGGVATLSQLTPQIVASRWQSARLTPEERQVRALVMQEAAQVINDLYGAAVSAGEMGRANTFVPTGLDNPETVAIKLKAAQSWAASKAAQYGRQVQGTAQARMGGEQPNVIDFGRLPSRR